MLLCTATRNESSRRCKDTKLAPTWFFQGQIWARTTDGLDFMQNKMASQTVLRNIILLEKGLKKCGQNCNFAENVMENIRGLSSQVAELSLATKRHKKSGNRVRSVSWCVAFVRSSFVGKSACFPAIAQNYKLLELHASRVGIIRIKIVFSLLWICDISLFLETLDVLTRKSLYIECYMRVVDYWVNYVCIFKYFVEVKVFPEVCGSLNLV